MKQVRHMYEKHGITKILILNGHGGNVLPVKGVIQQWQLHLTSVYGNPINNTAKPIDSSIFPGWGPWGSPAG